MRPALASLLAGSVAGIALLGIGGRLAMAGLTLLSGARPRFSWGGSLEVVVLGFAYGFVGGVLHMLLTRRPTGIGRRRGLLLGVALCLVAWLSSPVARASAASSPLPTPLLVLISLPFFVSFGIVTDALAFRIGTRAG